jgi:uncharacterized membrane protein
MFVLMEAVFQYRIPVLHPLAVHFPLSLLLAAGVAAVVWMISGVAFWRRCCLFLLVMGVAGAVLAYLSGKEMEEQVEGVAIVEELVGLHETMAFLTVIGSSIATLVLGIVSLRAERKGGVDRLGLRLFVGSLVLAAAALVAFTAHIGSTMVWGVAA